MSTIYTPPNSTLASTITSPQVRLLLHGRPASGKTTAALTFPNPVVANFDGQELAIKQCAPHALIMPFNDPDWCKRICPAAPSPMAAFKYWLNQEARKFTNEQSLIIDSLSSWQDSFHATQEAVAKANAKLSKITGEMETDERGYVWGEKLKYFRDCHAIFSSLKCNVVLTCHDSEVRDDKTGMLVTKVKPSMTGSFADHIGRYFTDVFHQECSDKKDEKGLVIKDKAGNTVADYLWRTRGDARFDLRTRIPNCPAVISACYKSFTTTFPAVPQ